MDAAGRAAGLTRQLLSFARQDSVNAEVIDLNATVEEMLDLLRRTLGTHIQLSTTLEPGLDRVRIDPGQLGQILVNVAVNSRDAMPDGGSRSRRPGPGSSTIRRSPTGFSRRGLMRASGSTTAGWACPAM